MNRMVILKLENTSVSSEGLLKHKLLSSACKVPDSKPTRLNKWPGDSHAVSPQTTLGNHLHRKEALKLVSENGCSFSYAIK